MSRFKLPAVNVDPVYIKSFRAKFNLTQDQLGGLLGVSRLTVANLEKPGAYLPLLYQRALDSIYQELIKNDKQVARDTTFAQIRQKTQTEIEKQQEEQDFAIYREHEKLVFEALQRNEDPPELDHAFAERIKKYNWWGA